MRNDAVIVGAGPNGLAAAVELARHGLEVTVLEAAEQIGGCARSGELVTPGVLHDLGASTHPTGAISPLFRSLGLTERGLHWLRPRVDLAHPLDNGRVGALTGSVAETAALLGADGTWWRRMFAPLADKAEALATELLGPVAHLPKHPVTLAEYGLRAAFPASILTRVWREEPARALFGGLAAHLFGPLNRPLSSALGVLFTALGHNRGWPVAAGGTQTIVDQLAALLRELGGRVETGFPVRSPRDLPTAAVTLLDLAPRQAIELLGDRLPNRVRRDYARFEHAPGAFKLDLTVRDGLPWLDEASGQAGTVHLGGTFAEVAAAEAEIARGRMPERPFMLVSQQYLADPDRSNGDLHPVSAYAHVPHGYPGDATEAMLRQFERYAPGTRERIIDMRASSTAKLERDNPNHLGGDIITGANSIRQLLARPRPTPHPYDTGVPGVYLCSAATPPGAGVHGMCGYHAARAALRHLKLN